MSLNEIDNDTIGSTSTLQKEFNLSKYNANKILKLISQNNYSEIEKIIPDYKNSKRFKKAI